MPEPNRPRFISSILPILLLLHLPHTAQAQHLSPAPSLTPLPPGLTLPVQIGHALHAGSTKPGTPIVAYTTQRVLVTKLLYLKRGAQLLGTIVASTSADTTTSKPATLTIRFTALRYHHQTVPILTRAIAIANFTDVDDTEVLATGSTDRGNSSAASWTTRQIGGDEVYRSGWIGEVDDDTMHRVGFADYFGVYADPPPNATGSAAIPHSMGVFSTTARGLYGFDEGAALHSSAGNITVTSPRKLVIRNGDNLLLQVLPPPDTSSDNRTQSSATQLHPPIA
jgi:hypothetical protein